MKRQIQWKMLWHCDSPTYNAVVSFSIHGRRNGENDAFLCKEKRRKYMNAKKSPREFQEKTAFYGRKIFGIGMFMSYLLSILFVLTNYYVNLVRFTDFTFPVTSGVCTA